MVEMKRKCRKWSHRQQYSKINKKENHHRSF